MARNLKVSGNMPGYQTFLVTCWLEQDESVDISLWRFRLETIRSGKQRVFTTLEEVMVTIQSEIQSSKNRSDK